jgi:hypothetical protein
MNSESDFEEVLRWAEQDGVDLTMLRERLRLSPTDRLRRHESALALVEAIKQAKETRLRASGRAHADRPVRR